MMMNDPDNLVPPVEAPKKQKITRLHWKPDEEMKLLRQYRIYLDEYDGRDAEMWDEIYKDLVGAGVHVTSVRAVKERCVKILQTFRSTDVFDRWKTGDPGQFSDWEKLLCDICNHVDDKKKRVTQGSQRKTVEQEKQQRKDAKMMHAASHSIRKRKKGPTPALIAVSEGTADTSSGDLEGEPPVVSQRERTSHNHTISDFLNNTKTVRNRQLKLEEGRLAFEKENKKRLEAESVHKMDMERQRLEVEKKRDENSALMAQTLMQAITAIQNNKNAAT